jgi:Family of unknown function (DUF6186)
MTRAQTFLGYAVIVLAIVALELAARRRSFRFEVPTLAVAASTLARSRIGKWLLVAGWLWLGWHLFVRAHHG